MSRDESDDKTKEIVHLRLRLHHAEMQVERTTQTTHYFSIEARDFEAKWLRVLEENETLRKELQATREDLDRANEILAKLFKKRS
jgi:outer membrane murein-binding lipoprotein Lpp